MFDLEDYSTESHKDYGKADYLRLEVGKRIRNITLTGISEGSNQYGYFCMAFFKTDTNAKGFINLSPKLVDELTAASSSGRVLNPELQDEKIWVGKKAFVTDSGDQRSFFEWEFEE